MRFGIYLQKRLSDLIEEKRVVVWYDSEGDFKSFIAGFRPPNCVVLSTVESTLRARRRADEIYRLMNESEKPVEAGKNMLIYIPRSRGATEEEKRRDPFEVYALAGTAFGDTEDQKLESLARQAMPEKSSEISRLFREGRPDIALLEGLEKSRRSPLLNKVFGTESEADVIALALCDTTKAKAVDETLGCIEELLRLFESAVGFKSGSEERKWETMRRKAAEYVLYSEFAFDLPKGPPEALGVVPRAPEEAKGFVFSACDRMRSDLGMRDIYMESAQKIEAELRLADIFPADFIPGERDTFPFEEHRLFLKAIKSIVTGDLGGAKSVIESRKRSIWIRDPQRSPVWTTLERATALLESATKISEELKERKDLQKLVKAYVLGGWADLDRTYRLFETSLTATAEEETLSPLLELCRHRYRDTALAVQDLFLTCVRSEGWPPEGVPRQTRVFAEHAIPVLEQRGKIAVFLVDSLTYEMGRDLGAALAGAGEVEIRYAAAVVPTVTGLGMAALMPGADGMLRLVEKDGGLVPALGKRLLKTSADRMKLLTETYGDRFFQTTLDDLLGSGGKSATKVKNIELLVVRTQDPDAIAENLGPWRARRYLTDVIGDIAAGVRSVVSMGFPNVLIAADHGHIMLPEIPAGEVVKGPSGGWLESKRRCLLGSGMSTSPGTITLKAGHVGIQGDVQEVCLPIGFRVFAEGEGYFHGGLSLQEAVIPVIVLRAGKRAPVAAGKPEIEIRYRSDKFTSRVIGLKFHFQRDLLGAPVKVRIEVYNGPGAKADLVGEAADCEARDEKTREVSLQANKETPVPVLIDPDFNGPEVEIRVSDPHTRVVWARRRLTNAMLD